MLFLSDRTSRISYFQQKRSKVWLCVHKCFLAAIPKFRKFCFISASEWQHTVLIKKSGSHNPLTNLRGTVRLQLELYWAPGEGVCLAREHTVCICAPHVRRTGGPVEEPATEGRAALVHGIPPRKSVAWLERPFISWMSLTLLLHIDMHMLWQAYTYVHMTVGLPTNTVLGITKNLPEALLILCEQNVPFALITSQCIS